MFMNASRHSPKPISLRILRRFDVPTLLLHGEDDQVVPVGTTARKAAKLIRDVEAIYYPGGAHGIPASHFDQVNSRLAEIPQEGRQKRQGRLSLAGQL